MRLIFRLGVAGVAIYVFLPTLGNIAAVDLVGSVAAGLGATMAAVGYAFD